MPAVPGGTEVGSTENVWQAITRLYVALVPVHPFASVTVTTIGNVPVCVGVPESVPFAASVRPDGSVDAVVNAALPIAPTCVNVWLNGVSGRAGRDAGARDGDRLAADHERVRRARCPVQRLPSVTLTTIGKSPVWVGMPERTPFAARIDVPPGAGSPS